MSRSRVIRGPRAAAVQGWRLSDFAARPEAAEPVVDQAVPEVVKPPEPIVTAEMPPPPPPPTVPLEQLHLEELEALRAEARREGFEAGRVEGFALGEAEAGELRLLVGHLRDLMEDLEQGIANDVLSLALELTKQIIRHGLRVQPELILSIIREAAKSFQGLGDSPKLILNPADAALLRAAEPDEPGGQWPWTVVEDAAIERGGCKFQTGSTEVDATLETRWRRVVASLGRDDAWLDLNL